MPKDLLSYEERAYSQRLPNPFQHSKIVAGALYETRKRNVIDIDLGIALRGLNSLRSYGEIDIIQIDMGFHDTSRSNSPNKDPTPHMTIRPIGFDGQYFDYRLHMYFDGSSSYTGIGHRAGGHLKAERSGQLLGPNSAMPPPKRVQGDSDSRSTKGRPSVNLAAPQYQVGGHGQSDVTAMSNPQSINWGLQSGVAKQSRHDRTMQQPQVVAGSARGTPLPIPALSVTGYRHELRTLTSTMPQRSYTAPPETYLQTPKQQKELQQQLWQQEKLHQQQWQQQQGLQKQKSKPKSGTCVVM